MTDRKGFTLLEVLIALAVFAIASLAAFITTIAVSVYPAIRAARLRPADAIRSI